MLTSNYKSVIINLYTTIKFMKRVLPNTHLKSFSSGFTLIELMVVIAIIAILAVIGATVFAGAQGSARDGSRRSEISSLAKSIEASKDYASGSYTYTTADAGRDFPKGVPTDPSSGNVYCVDANTTTARPADATAKWTTACPTNYSPLATSLATGGELAAGTAKSFTICASLERAAAPFCISSLTQ